MSSVEEALPSEDSSRKYKEQFSKRKLHGFLNDLLRVGSLKGFRYFGMYLRGREELLLRVQNEQTCSGHHPLGRCESQGVENEYAQNSSDSFPLKTGLPRNSESFVLSRDAQRTLSGFQFLAIGLPPASPCSSEISPVWMAETLSLIGQKRPIKSNPARQVFRSMDNYTTLFLIASYARYKSPYVWVRSNHERLIKLSEKEQGEQTVVKDSPLKLRTVLDWSAKDIKIWDIIGEIVRINVQPQPRNPFAVDHSYFDTLSHEECIIATGAMVEFLQRVLKKEHSYNSLVSADLYEVMKRHFQELQSWSCRPPSTPVSPAFPSRPRHESNGYQYNHQNNGIAARNTIYYR